MEPDEYPWPDGVDRNGEYDQFYPLLTNAINNNIIHGGRITLMPNHRPLPNFHGSSVAMTASYGPNSFLGVALDSADSVSVQIGSPRRNQLKGPPVEERPAAGKRMIRLRQLKGDKPDA